MAASRARAAAASGFRRRIEPGPPDQHDELTPAVPRPTGCPTASHGPGRPATMPPAAPRSSRRAGQRRGGSGSRGRAVPSPSPRPTSPPVLPAPTGLGLADLLAGALAAYRGI